MAFGCILGMFPLFFLPGHNRPEEEEEELEGAAEELAEQGVSTVAVLPAVKAEAPSSGTVASEAVTADSVAVKDVPVGSSVVSSASSTALAESVSQAASNDSPSQQGKFKVATLSAAITHAAAAITATSVSSASKDRSTDGGTAK